MRNIRNLSMIIVFIMAVVSIQFMSTDAQARSSYYDAYCVGCHSAASTNTCNGCHHHGPSNLTGTTNKTTYAPGETVSVTINGGRSGGGWVRAILYNQNGQQVSISSGNNSGMGNATEFPTVLSAPAPTTPGTYTWKAAWFGNSFDSGSSNANSHGEVAVNTNTFTVAAPADTAAPVVGTFTLPATSDSLTIPVTSFSATDNIGVTGFLITTSASTPSAGSAGWTATAPTSVIASVPGSTTFYAWAKDAAGNVSASKNATVNITLNHFSTPTVTLLTATFSGEALVDGSVLGQTEMAVVGDEIGVFDGDGVLCGHFVVTNDGQFGPLVVYGDNPATTSIDEGASNGEPLTVIFWDNQRQMELAVRTLQPNGDRQTITWADNGGGTVTILGLAIDRIGVAKNSNWYLDVNDNGVSESTDLTYMYGSVTDQQLFGDWDGDGIATPGIKRGNTYYLRNSNTTGVADITFSYGASTDNPIVGDWDGNGADTIGIKRGNTYYLRNSNTTGVADITFSYGAPTDIPIVGDWDGDGIDTIGIKRGDRYFLRNSNTMGVADITFSYGTSTDIPIVGDWDGDGIESLGVYRSSDGNFYLRNTLSQGLAESVQSFGILEGTPIVGKW